MFRIGDRMLTDGNHARLVHSVTRGTSRTASAPEHVKRSWLRCLDEYGLDPESGGEPAVLSHQELLARKEQSLELLSFADTEMAHLHRQLAGSGHSIILTDRDGVLLSHYGDPSFRHAAARPGPGAGGGGGGPAWCPGGYGASATAAPTAWEPASPSARRSSCIATSTSSRATPASPAARPPFSIPPASSPRCSTHRANPTGRNSTPSCW